MRHRDHGHRASSQSGFSGKESKIEVSSRGLIAVDPQTTDDLSPGHLCRWRLCFWPTPDHRQRGDGKRAAVGIDEFLRGQKHADPIMEVEVFDMHQMITNYLDIARQSVPMLPLERRTGVTEVEIGYDEQTAMEEAQRCLHCWVNTVFEGTEGWQHVHSVRRLR